MPPVEVGSIGSFPCVLAVRQTHQTLPRHGHLQYLPQAEDAVLPMEPAGFNQSVQVDFSSFSIPCQGAWAALCSDFFLLECVPYRTISPVAMFSDCCGLISQELKASKMLELTWRVAYSKEPNATWQMFRQTTTVSLQPLHPFVLQFQ